MTVCSFVVRIPCSVSNAGLALKVENRYSNVTFRDPSRRDGPRLDRCL